MSGLSVRRPWEQKINSVELRRLVPGDAKLLREYLHLALFVPEGEPPPASDVVDQPALARYVAEWGRPGDLGYLALERGDEDVGAAWLRLWPAGDAGFAFVDEVTPELSIAVRPEWRGRGIGTLLLGKLLADADRRHAAVSLSVAAANPAINLYRRCGFHVIGRSGDSVTMRRGRKTGDRRLV